MHVTAEGFKDKDVDETNAKAETSERTCFIGGEVSVHQTGVLKVTLIIWQLLQFVSHNRSLI